MNWKDLIESLLRDFRLSEYQLSSITGITQPTIHRIRNGVTETPTQNTIKLLEQGLKIKIDDSDPENITYKKLVPEIEWEKVEGVKIYEFPIITKVYAGASPNMFISENIIDYIALPYGRGLNILPQLYFSYSPIKKPLLPPISTDSLSISSINL